MAAPVQPPYTPVVRAGDWVIVSGQLGMKDGALVPGGVLAQTAQAVVNLKAQLATMGATVNDIAKTLCFLTDMDTFPQFNESYAAGFGSARPARSTIGVKQLPFGGAVEIEAWAYLPAGAAKKKTAAKKSAAKKSAAKKPAAKKTAKKAATKKTATKRSAPKKTAKKSPARKKK
jgi:2-iminobutanoate/2-iminopropanoate deaminase